MKTNSIPDDILRDILSPFPVKILLRFRSVSRQWRRIIDDSDFSSLHLTRFKSNHNESSLFVIHPTVAETKCFVICSETLRTIATNDSFPTAKFDQRWSVICSVNGLYALRNYSGTPELMLWNPSIRKSLILPPCPEVCSGVSKWDFGLGFDPTINDYKYVRFILAAKGGVQSVQVFTLGANSWKTIEFRGHGCSEWREDFDYYCTPNRLCFKGSLYALFSKNATNIMTHVISFDLSRETFGSIRFAVVDVVCTPVLTIADGGSSLAVIYMRNRCISMWILDCSEANCKSWSWTQRYAYFYLWLPYDVYSFWFSKFFYLKKNNELLLHSRDGIVVFYNLDTDKTYIRRMDNAYAGMAWPYVESLALLSCV